MAMFFAPATAVPRTFGPSGLFVRVATGAGAGSAALGASATGAAACGCAGAAASLATSAFTAVSVSDAARTAPAVTSRRTAKRGTATTTAPPPTKGQTRLAGGVDSIGRNSGRSVDMSVSSRIAARGGGHGTHRLDAAEEAFVDRLGGSDRRLAREEGGGGRVVRVEHPDDEEAARAGIDRRAQGRGHLRAAIAHQADGARGGVARVLVLVLGEEAIGIAQLLLRVAAGVGALLDRVRQRTAGLQDRVDAPARAERRVGDAPGGGAAFVDEARLAVVDARLEERQRESGGEHLARVVDDVVQLQRGEPRPEGALLLPAPDEVVGALIAVDGAERRDLGREIGVEAVPPILVRVRCDPLGGAGDRERDQREDRDLLQHDRAPPYPCKQKNRSPKLQRRQQGSLDRVEQRPLAALGVDGPGHFQDRADALLPGDVEVVEEPLRAGEVIAPPGRSARGLS